MQHDAIQHVEWWMHKREESGFGSLGYSSVPSVPRHQTTWKRIMRCSNCSSSFKIRMLFGKMIWDRLWDIGKNQQMHCISKVTTRKQQEHLTLKKWEYKSSCLRIFSVWKPCIKNHSHFSNYKMFCHRSKQSICVCTLTNDVCKWLSKRTYLISVPPKFENQPFWNPLKNKSKILF